MKLKTAASGIVAAATAAIIWNSACASGGEIIPPALFSQLAAFHGHVCAGSLFGARLGLAAKEALKEAGGTGKLTATCFSHSCPVDGIQVAVGTTCGNKALTVLDRKEHRLVLTATGNKRTVEARLTRKAEELGLKSRDLGKKAKVLPTGSPERSRVEQEIEEIYKWLQTAPAVEVVSVTKGT